MKLDFLELIVSEQRENFRQHSYLSDIAQGVICGLGANGYEYALNAAQVWLQKNRSS